MDFKKYLPKYLIVKNVLTIEGCTSHKYFITTPDEVNLKLFTHKNIISWHPLIVRNGSNFYYFKGLKKSDFAIASFCLNNQNYEPEYNTRVLENYFNKNSFEI